MAKVNRGKDLRVKKIKVSGQIPASAAGEIKKA
jgi:hypothetical protein